MTETIQGRWVPVSEALPPVEVTVAMHHKTYGVCYGWLAETSEEDRVFLYDEGVVFDGYAWTDQREWFEVAEVTHWFEVPPLPEV